MSAAMASAAASAASRAACSSASRTMARARLTALLFFAARDDLIQLLPVVGDHVDGSHRGVLEIAVHRDRQQFRAVAARAQRLDRVRAHRFEHGVPRDRAEHVRIVDSRERADRHDLARRALGDLGERARIADFLDGLEALGFARRPRTPRARCRAASSTACCRTLSSRSSRAIAASGPGAISLATAARRTRASSSSRAIAAIVVRSSSGSSSTKARRTAGSGCLSRDWVRKRSSSVIHRSSLAVRSACEGGNHRRVREETSATLAGLSAIRSTSSRCPSHAFRCGRALSICRMRPSMPT